MRALRLVTLSAVLVGGAASGPRPTYESQRDLSRQAVDQGDAEAAAAHAAIAWQAAEKELGDSRETARLAYAYGKLVVFDDPEEAQKAFQRVKDLLEAGIADAPVAGELRVYIAYARFKPAGLDKDAAAALEDALEAAEEQNISFGPPLAKFWLDLAQRNLDMGRHRKARDIASKAEAAVDMTEPGAYRMKAQAIMISGEGRLIEMPSTRDRVEDALSEFRRGEKLFPAQRDIESFDPILAQLMAWENVAMSMLVSAYHRSFADVSCETCVLGIEGQKSNEECGIEWARRVPPEYPRKHGENDFILAGVIVGYRLGDDLKVHDARVLAQAGGSNYAENSLKAMDGWRLKSMPEDPACRESRLTSFIFWVR